MAVATALRLEYMRRADAPDTAKSALSIIDESSENLLTAQIREKIENHSAFVYACIPDKNAAIATVLKSKFGSSDAFRLYNKPEKNGNKLPLEIAFDNAESTANQMRVIIPDFLCLNNIPEIIAEEDRIRAEESKAPQRKNYSTDADYYTAVYNKTFGYISRRGVFFEQGKQGKEDVKLANFTAMPIAQAIIDDGTEIKTVYKIEGVSANGTHFPAVPVDSAEFEKGKMEWISAWGFDANIEPISSARQKMTHAIKAAGSIVAEHHHVYAHTGWRKIDGKLCYLYPGGSIGADGIEVDLQDQTLNDLYHFTKKKHDPIKAMQASIGLIDGMQPEISYPLWATMYLAPLTEFFGDSGNDIKHVLFLCGTTGKGKSTKASIFLSHFSDASTGNRFSANFESTANAIMEKAWRIKDAPFYVDDFHSGAMLRDTEKATEIVDRFVKGYANRASRDTMTANRELRTSKPPRGIGIFSGEEMPRCAQSDKWRMFPQDFTKANKIAQVDLDLMRDNAYDGVYAKAMMGYIEWLSTIPDLTTSIKETFRSIKDSLPDRFIHLKAGTNSRIIEAVAHMVTGAKMACDYAVSIGAMEADDAEETIIRFKMVLSAMAEKHIGNMAETEPINLYITTIQNAISTSAKGELIAERSTITNYQIFTEKLIGLYDDQYYYFFPDAAYKFVLKELSLRGIQLNMSDRTVSKELAAKELISEHAGAKAFKHQVFVNGKRPWVYRIDKATFDTYQP